MCDNNKYPVLKINLGQIRHNAKKVVSECANQNIAVAGVIKALWGDEKTAFTLKEAGVKQIASSRIKQLKRVKAAGVDLPLMLIRIPMMSEAADVVMYADISLQSDINVLKKFNEEAKKQNKKHKVVLMLELGDLREGIWDKEEALNMALVVENELPYLELAGVGTNLGCYGSIVTTVDKMEELVDFARRVEDAIGRKLEIVSGGGTRAYARVLANDMPEGINHLRIGCQILIARELEEIWDYDLGDVYQDIFTLQAELVEIREKPTHPFGEIGVDAFRNVPVYEDRGVRKKGLLAIGKADYGMSLGNLKPLDKSVEIVGASSDHTIVDIHDAERKLVVGDVLNFSLDYGAVMHSCCSEDITIVYEES